MQAPKLQNSMVQTRIQTVTGNPSPITRKQGVPFKARIFRTPQAGRAGVKS